MTKYRLNIKYPIERKYLEQLNDGGISISWVFNKDGSVISSEEIRLKVVPKEWLTELKESGFDRFMDNSVFTDTDWRRTQQSDFNVQNMSECWQASQENRDLLYKDLMDSIARFILDKYNTNCMKEINSVSKLIDEYKNIELTLSKT